MLASIWDNGRMSTLEEWRVAENVGGADITCSLPPEPPPGTVLTIRRGDMAGTGVLMVEAAAADRFNSPSGARWVALPVPMQECRFVYARVDDGLRVGSRVSGGERATAGVWYMLA
jgi:hypothetical protein